MIEEELYLTSKKPYCRPEIEIYATLVEGLLDTGTTFTSGGTSENGNIDNGPFGINAANNPNGDPEDSDGFLTAIEAEKPFEKYALPKFKDVWQN